MYNTPQSSNAGSVGGRGSAGGRLPTSHGSSSSATATPDPQQPQMYGAPQQRVGGYGTGSGYPGSSGYPATSMTNGAPPPPPPPGGVGTSNSNYSSAPPAFASTSAAYNPYGPAQGVTSIGNHSGRHSPAAASYGAASNLPPSPFPQQFPHSPHATSGGAGYGGSGVNGGYGAGAPQHHYSGGPQPSVTPPPPGASTRSFAPQQVRNSPLPDGSHGRGGFSTGGAPPYSGYGSGAPPISGGYLPPQQPQTNFAPHNTHGPSSGGYPPSWGQQHHQGPMSTGYPSAPSYGGYNTGQTNLAGGAGYHQPPPSHHNGGAAPGYATGNTPPYHQMPPPPSPHMHQPGSASGFSSSGGYSGHSTPNPQSGTDNSGHHNQYHYQPQPAAPPQGIHIPTPHGGIHLPPPPGNYHNSRHQQFSNGNSSAPHSQHYPNSLEHSMNETSFGSASGGHFLQGSGGSNSGSYPPQHQAAPTLSPHHHHHHHHHHDVTVGGFPLSSAPSQIHQQQALQHHHHQAFRNAPHLYPTAPSVGGMPPPQSPQFPANFPPAATYAASQHHGYAHPHHAGASHGMGVNSGTNIRRRNSNQHQQAGGANGGLHPSPNLGMMHHHHHHHHHHGMGHLMQTAAPPATSIDGYVMGDESSGTPSLQHSTTSTMDLYSFLRSKQLLERQNLGDMLPDETPSGDGSFRDVDVDDDGESPKLPKIAIDGNYSLVRLRETLRTRDPLWFTHSALPKLLLDLVAAEVNSLRDIGLEPLYVFNGIGASGDVEAFLTPSSILSERAVVWEELERRRTIPADQTYLAETFDVQLGEDVEMAIARFLRKEMQVTVLVAPFLHWPQMLVLHKEGVVQLLFAPPEALAFAYDDTELIMDIDLTSPSAPVAVVKRRKVLEVLFPHFIFDNPDGSRNYSRAGDRLLDFCLLTSTHPAIQSLRASVGLSIQELYHELSSPGRPNFDGVKDVIERTSGAASVAPTVPSAAAIAASNDGTALPTSKSEWLKHAKGRCFLRQCVVFSTSSSAPNPLVYLSQALAAPGSTPPRPPANISGVFGNMVPMALFFLQYCGLLSVSSMTCITQTYICDESPICDTDEFHETMNVLISLRTQVTYQLVRELSTALTVLKPQAPAAPPSSNPAGQQHGSSVGVLGGGGMMVGVSAPNASQMGSGGAAHGNGYSDRLKTISWVRWFRPILQPVSKPGEIIKLDDWRIPPQRIAALSSNDPNDVSRIQLDDVLSFNALAVPAVARGSQAAGLYNSKAEVYCAVLLKSFDLLGYFTHAVQTTTNAVVQTASSMENASLTSSAAGGAVADAFGPSVSPSSVELNPNGTQQATSSNASSGGIRNNIPSGSSKAPTASSASGSGASTTEVQSGLSPFSLEIKYVVGCDAKHQYQYILLTELVRTQSMSAHPLKYLDDHQLPIRAASSSAGSAYHNASSSSASAGAHQPYYQDTDASSTAATSDDANTTVELIIRVACAVALESQRAYDMSTSEYTWRPLYCKSIVAFMQIVRMTHRALRELVEVMAVSLYLDGSACCPIADFADLAQDLPFATVPNALGALLVRYVLREGAEVLASLPSREARIADIGLQFPMLADVTASLEEVFVFVLHGLHLLHVFNETDHELVDSELSARVPDAVDAVVRAWRLLLGSSIPVCHVRMEDTLQH